MQKIFYLVSTLGRTGPTQQLFNIVSNLDRKRFEPYVLTLSPESSDSIAGKFDDVGVSRGSLGLSRMTGMFRAKREVRAAIAHVRPDVIHSQGFRADRIMSVMRDVGSRVATQRNYPFEDYPMKFGWLRGLPMAHLHYAAFRLIPNVVACSQTIAELDRRHGLEVVAIQNGVDLSTFRGPVSTDQKAIIRRKLGLSSGKTIFITVGALLKRKATDVLLKAFTELRKEREYQLLVVGDGPERTALESLVVDKESVRFVGHVSNVRDFLAASDCFISASRSEGLPNTVIEAMATGLQVILSDIPQHREILGPGAEMFESLFPLDDEEALVGKMLEFTYDSGACSAGWRIICERFNARKMSEAYQALYLKLSMKNPERVSCAMEV